MNNEPTKNNGQLTYTVGQVLKAALCCLYPGKEICGQCPFNNCFNSGDGCIPTLKKELKRYSLEYEEVERIKKLDKYFSDTPVSRARLSEINPIQEKTLSITFSEPAFSLLSNTDEYITQIVEDCKTNEIYVLIMPVKKSSCIFCEKETSNRIKKIGMYVQSAKMSLTT